MNNKFDKQMAKYNVASVRELLPIYTATRQLGVGGFHAKQPTYLIREAKPEPARLDAVEGAPRSEVDLRARQHLSPQSLLRLLKNSTSTDSNETPAELAVSPQGSGTRPTHRARVGRIKHRCFRCSSNRELHRLQASEALLGSPPFRG